MAMRTASLCRAIGIMAAIVLNWPAVAQQQTGWQLVKSNDGSPAIIGYGSGGAVKLICGPPRWFRARQLLMTAAMEWDGTDPIALSAHRDLEIDEIVIAGGNAEVRVPRKALLGLENALGPSWLNPEEKINNEKDRVQKYLYPQNWAINHPAYVLADVDVSADVANILRTSSKLTVSLKGRKANLGTQLKFLRWPVLASMTGDLGSGRDKILQLLDNCGKS
jgi:hypothetical protein